MSEPLSTSLRAVLEAVRDGTLTPAEAEARATRMAGAHAFEDLGFARVDHGRLARQGFPEVVFGQGKTPRDVARISRAIVDRGHSLLVTRTTADAFDEVAKLVPDARFHERPGIIERRIAMVRGVGTIVVAPGGPSGLPVAEEAAGSAEVMANDVERVYDVGVAGLNRLLVEHERLTKARVL